MTKTKVVIVATMLALGACGGGSGSGNDGGNNTGTTGGGSFTTTLPPSKALNTLTPAEATTLCMDVGKAYMGSDLDQGACKLGAYFVAGFTAELDTSLTDAQIQAMCMQSYTACLSQGPDAGTDMCMAPGPTCTATVAELSACVKEGKMALTASFAAIPSCNAITRASLDIMTAADGGAPDTMTGPACAAFAAKCPDSMITP